MFELHGLNDNNEWECLDTDNNSNKNLLWSAFLYCNRYSRFRIVQQHDSKVLYGFILRMDRQYPWKGEIIE